MTDYALQTDQLGSDALDIQQAYVGEATEKELLQAGLQEGMQVWEYGCGNGATTMSLAKSVGPQGHVTEIDQSSE
jgi:ubiquinone/menaquinone biosynthesis C-methylase UbiE